jgi:cytokinin dehydrogenase
MGAATPWPQGEGEPDIPIGREDGPNPMPANPAEQRPTTLPQVEGELRFDEAARSERADDFGHIVHKVPDGVLLPESSDDVATMIKWTAQRGGRFAAQGQRHSTFGRSQVAGGIVADMSTLRNIGGVEGDHVVVEAGAKWSDVLRATLAQGRTPPVLTEYLELSVGGTLVVGGVGGTTSTFGVQSDNVTDLEVVTGDGDKISCSASHNADLFDAMRAGLGQVGVITKATLKLVAAPESVRRFLLSYPDLATMLKDERLLSDDTRFDAVQGAIVPAPSGGFAFRLDVVKFFTTDPPDDKVLLAGLSDEPAERRPTTIGYFDYLNRLAALEAALRANGQWFFPHPWLTTFIGDSRVESVVDAELTALNPAADLGRFGQVVLSPIRRSAISSPLLRLPSDDLCYAFNLIRIPTIDDATETKRLVEANRATYRRVKEAGGTLLPVSAFPQTQDEWRDHFGSAFEQLHAAKRKYDPGVILTPGYEIF